jgi:hypothetical protein
MAQYVIIIPNGEKVVIPEQMSRTMFCPECAQHKCPQIGDSVLLYQTNAKRKFLARVNENSEIKHWGYTPHWITDIVIDGDKQEAIYTKVCGVNGCGHFLKERKLEENNGKIQWDTIIKNAIRESMELKHFIAFVDYKDPTYYVGIQK